MDEAQAIKNPGTRQTRAVKQLRADARIALTGTPVENRIGDLWSIFDFLNPGLLGSAKEFTRFAKRLSEREHNTYGPLRDLVRPYILRRLKTPKDAAHLGLVTDHVGEAHAGCLLEELLQTRVVAVASGMEDRRDPLQ